MLWPQNIYYPYCLIKLIIKTIYQIKRQNKSLFGGKIMQHSMAPEKKLISFLKTTKHEIMSNGSINVDTDRVYEIKEIDSNVRTIDLEPIVSARNKYQLKAQLYDAQTKKRTQSVLKTRKENFVEKDNLKKSGQNSQNVRGSHRQKLHPEQQFFRKVQTFLQHFININSSQRKPSKITSEQFYNLFQSRKNICESESMSQAKFLFEISYTNYLSFLQFIITTKQKRYEIYAEFQEMQKIISMINAQIDAVEEIYLVEESRKMDVLFSNDQISAIENLQQEIDKLYPAETQLQLIPIVQEQNADFQGKSRDSHALKIFQEGQLDPKLFSNSSFEIKPIRDDLIELEISQSLVIESRQDPSSMVQEISIKEEAYCQAQNKQEKLFSSMEQQQIYSKLQNSSSKVEILKDQYFEMDQNDEISRNFDNACF